ncbi:hypothetical protein FQN54_004824 [Arachnomyces sp. PD_36]|nr:hypothetical protein FQN54_004824 [Arachnomyces sp. PD_36]
MAPETQNTLEVRLEYSHCPAVLDLSGEHLFDALLKVRRPHSDSDPRPITLLTTGSVLDPRAAFSNGSFELFGTGGKGNSTSIKNESGNGETRGIDQAPKDAFVTLPSRAGPRGGLHRRLHFDIVVPLRIREHLGHLLLPNKTYRLKLVTKSLGIKWWCYGTKEDLPTPLPPSEPAELTVRKSDGGRSFHTVSSLPRPPPISVSISLSAPIVRRAEDDPPILRIEATNRSDKPVTLRPRGHQNYVRPDTSGLPEPHPWHSIIAPGPALENFCINRIPDGEDCIIPRIMNVLTTGQGYKRSSFMTLVPGEPVVREVPFLQRARGVRERMGHDAEYRLKLRDAGLWWFEGTVDDLFGEEDSIRTLPNTRTTPVIPYGENELSFRLESQI